MWCQSAKPASEANLCQRKTQSHSSLWTTASWPWAELSCGTREGALLETPHQCGLVIPAPLYGPLRGGSLRALPWLPALKWVPGPPRCPLRVRWLPRQATQSFPWPARPAPPPLGLPAQHLSVSCPAQADVPARPSTLTASLCLTSLLRAHITKFNLKHMEIEVCMNPRKISLSQRNIAL